MGLVSRVVNRVPLAVGQIALFSQCRSESCVGGSGGADQQEPAILRNASAKIVFSHYVLGCTP